MILLSDARAPEVAHECPSSDVRHFASSVATAAAYWASVSPNAEAGEGADHFLPWSAVDPDRLDEHGVPPNVASQELALLPPHRVAAWRAAARTSPIGHFDFLRAAAGRANPWARRGGKCTGAACSTGPADPDDGGVEAGPLVARERWERYGNLCPPKTCPAVL
jgi:hypothetical protein